MKNFILKNKLFVIYGPKSKIIKKILLWKIVNIIKNRYIKKIYYGWNNRCNNKVNKRKAIWVKKIKYSFWIQHNN
jgi:hypothetical protein